MSVVKAAAPVKKGTIGTEVIIGQSAVALKKVVGDITAAVGLITDDLVEKAENLSAQIADKEAKIVDLDVEFAEKRRQAEVSLDIALQSNADAKVTSILTSQGKIAVSRVDFDSLNNTLSSLKDKFDSEVRKAEQTAFGIAKKELEQSLKNKDLEFAAKKAQNEAELSQKDAQIKFLNEQVTMWKSALDSERTAGVERAKASSIGAVNITGSK